VNTVFAAAAKQSADSEVRFLIIATTKDGAGYVYAHEASRTLLNRATVEQIRADLDGYTLERATCFGAGKRKVKPAPEPYEGTLLTDDSQVLSVTGARNATVDICVSLGEALDAEDFAGSDMSVDHKVEVLPPLKNTHAGERKSKHHHHHKRAASASAVQTEPKRSAPGLAHIEPQPPTAAAMILARWRTVAAPVVDGYAQACAQYLDL
jgi:hypothetical protein